MKKLASLIVVFCLVLVLSATAFATEAEQSPGAMGNNLQFDGTVSEQVDLNGLLKSVTPPSSSHNLGGGAYVANLDYVSVNWLYTNSYFKPNSAGKINVSYNVVSNGVLGTMSIGLLDMATGSMVATWVSGEIGYDGGSGSMNFYNLDKTKNYAVAFRGNRVLGGSIPTYIGNATISW